MTHRNPNLEACRGGVIAIGNFDGVHLGHQRMISVLKARAEEASVPAVAMTFDPPPVALLRPDKVPPSLTTISHRTELLKRYGMDEVLIWPTSTELLNLTPREFFDEVILNQLRAVGMVEGPNFFFGKDRAGDVQTLAEFCSQSGLSLEIVRPVVDGESLVSSSRVRKLIGSNGLDEAVEMLGHPYRLTGLVGHGASRGRTIGFPTANLTEIRTLVPSEGVYAGLCEIEGRECSVAVNIGQNPTFNDDVAKVEAHVIDWDGDLYGAQLAVDLLSRIRAVQTFESAGELQQQIEKDVESARRACERFQSSQ